MNLSKVFLTAIAISMIPFSAFASAPFGLEWGMTAKEVKIAGVDLSSAMRAEDVDDKDRPLLLGGAQNGVFYLTSSLPAGSSEVEQYLLGFGVDGRLAFLSATGHVLDERSKKALIGTRAYRAAAKKLERKYGEKYDKVETLLDSQPTYTQRGTTYGCLSRANCGRVFSAYRGEGGEVVLLELKAADRYSGYLTVSFESSSHW